MTPSRDSHSWTMPTPCPRCAGPPGPDLGRGPAPATVGLGLGTCAHRSPRPALLRSRLHFLQNLLAQGLDLGFGLRQGGVQSSLPGPPMRDALKAQRLPQGEVFGQERRQLLGFERPQHHPHHGQQQEGSAGEGAWTAPLAVRREFHVVFFNLLDYLEQCVGGDGAFRGRVFKLPDASREFLSVGAMVQAAARAPVESGPAGADAD